MPRRGGYVLDVQTDHLDHFRSRAVVPLLPANPAPPPVRELNPVFEIDGAPHVMLTQAIASVGSKELGRPVASLASRHDDVARAMDILLVGY